MKKIIAKILRRWADKLVPTEGIYFPARSYRLGNVLGIRIWYQYPKDETTLNFDDIRETISRRMAEELVKQGAVTFTFIGSNGFSNTIEAKTYVQLPDPLENDKENL